MVDGRLLRGKPTYCNHTDFQSAGRALPNRHLASGLRPLKLELFNNLSNRRRVMVIESVFFYFVLLTLFIVLLNALLTKSRRRHDRRSHA
jgi:hypothetical protein